MWRSLNKICSNAWVQWAVHMKNAFTELQFFSAQDFSFNIWLFYRYVLDYISPFLYLLSASYLLWIFSTLSHRSTYLRHCFSPFCLSISSSEFGHLNHKSLLPPAGRFIDMNKDIRAFKKITYVLSSPDLYCSPSLFFLFPHLLTMHARIFA